jgi:enoyl-CoA hydratase/carnithine racemase
MTDTIEFSLTDDIGTLRIQQVERHNALGAAELAALQETLAIIEKDAEIRVLIITGAGDKTFCAGAALDDLNSGLISPSEFQGTMHRIATLPVPTIARLNGNVFGGGTELALSCDFRIGVDGMRLRVPAAALGLCYPPAGITRFVSKLGANTARRMLVASETLYADELLRLGFLDYLVSQERLDERTEELAFHMAGLAPLAVRAMKELVAAVESGVLDESRADYLSRLCEDSDDLQEGFAAQREKRAPRFAGY